MSKIKSICNNNVADKKYFNSIFFENMEELLDSIKQMISNDRDKS